MSRATSSRQRTRREQARQTDTRASSSSRSVVRASRRTAAAVAAIRAVFECDCEVFLVFNGTAANSLALLSDAGHMLTDAAALGLSLVAAGLARRPPGGVAS